MVGGAAEELARRRVGVEDRALRVEEEVPLVRLLDHPLELRALGEQAAVEMGEKLFEIAPDDVEVRHNVNQSLVALQRWDDLLPALLETKPLAIKETTM